MKRMRLWLILVVLLATMLWFLVRGAGRSQFEAWGEALGPVAFLEVHQRQGHFDGSVVARNVQMVANRQKYLKSLFFDEIVIQTPGLLHLLSTPFGASAEVPESFQMALNGVRGQPYPLADELGLIWLNFKSLVPFDGFSCRDSGELLDSDFGGMGLGGLRVNIGWSQKVDLGVSTVDFTWDNGSFAQLEIHAEVESLDLKQWFARQLEFQDIAIRNIHIRLTTGDYLPKRNAYCARLQQLTEAEFLENNLNLVRGFLGNLGVTVEDRLWALWSEFNTKGGVLELRSDYGNALRLGRLDGLSLTAALDLLKLKIKAGGGEVPLRVQDFVLPTLEISAQLPSGDGVSLTPPVTTDPGEPVEAEPVEAEVNPLAGITSGRNMAERIKPKTGGTVAQMAPPKPVVKAQRGPRSIDYGDIGSYLGRDLVFILQNGQRYRARPRGVNATEVQLNVILRGGSANMTIRRDRIKTIMTM